MAEFLKPTWADKHEVDEVFIFCSSYKILKES